MSLRWLLLVGLLGCGVAEDAEAPANDPAPAACSAVAQVAPALSRLLETDALPAIQALVGERLSDAQVSTLLDTVIRMVRGLDARQIDALLALADDPRLRALLPTLADLVRFFADDPPGLRPALLAELSRLLRICEGSTVFDAIDRLLGAPAFPALLSALGSAVELDVVQQLLGDAQGALRRPGFTALVCNILAALVRPGFSVQADIIRPLEGIEALPLDTPPLSDLLAALGVVLAADAGVLPAFGDLVCCDVYGVSRCAALPADASPLPRDPVFTWLLHALFVDGGVDLEAVLGQLAAVAADPDLSRALEPVAAVLRQIGTDPDLRAGLIGLFGALLQEDIARGVLPELVVLLESGAALEVLSLVRVILDGCEAPR